MKVKNGLRGALALLTATLIWGTSFVVMKDTLASVPTLYLLAIRFTIGAVVIALISFKQLKTINRVHLRYGLCMGLFLIAAYILQTYGLTMTTPGKNAFLTAVYCVMVPFFYWLLGKGRPDRYTVIAALLCIVGIGCISLENDLSFNLGDALTLLSGIFFAWHMIATSAGGIRCGEVAQLTLIQFIVVAIVAWIGALIFEQPPQALSATAIGSLAYLGVMATAVTLALQAIGQKYVTPSSTAVIMTMEAVFGTALSLILGREEGSARQFIGFALVFFAALMSETKLEFLHRHKRIR